MSYSELGIVNLALMRIGVARITSSDWSTPVTQQSLDATAAWEYVRDEVLEVADWRFAKTRAQLEQRYETPQFGFDYAYTLPLNFLRFVRPNREDIPVHPSDPMFINYTGFYNIPRYNPLITKVYPHRIETIPLPTGLDKVTNGTFTGAATGWTLGAQWSYGTNNVAKVAGGVSTLAQAYSSLVSVPVVGEKYSLELTLSAIAGGSLIPTVAGVTGQPISTIGTKTQEFVATSAASGITLTPTATGMTCTLDDVKLFLVSDKKCLLTDYDDTDDELYINYIAKIVDVTQYSPSFINALAWRLAAELSISRTESINDYKMCMEMYRNGLIQADSHNSSLDSIEDETGDNSWRNAGRW